MKEFENVKNITYNHCMETFEAVAEMTRDEANTYYYSDDADWMLDFDSYMMYKEFEPEEGNWDALKPEDFDDNEMRVIKAYEIMLFQVKRGNKTGKYFTRCLEILKAEKEVNQESNNMYREEKTVRLDAIEEYLLKNAIIKEIETINTRIAIINDPDITRILQTDVRRLVRVLKDELGGEM